MNDRRESWQPRGDNTGVWRADVGERVARHDSIIDSLRRERAFGRWVAATIALPVIGFCAWVVISIGEVRTFQARTGALLEAIEKRLERIESR